MFERFGHKERDDRDRNSFKLCCGLIFRDDVGLRREMGTAALHNRTTTKLRTIVADKSTVLLTFSCHVHGPQPALLRLNANCHSNLQ